MPVMIASSVISGIVTLALANRVAAFLQKNRAYEVLGLFILLLVGIMLLSEGGHLANLTLFGGEVHALNKTTFYFSVTVLILFIASVRDSMQGVQFESSEQLYIQQAMDSTYNSTSWCTAE